MSSVHPLAADNYLAATAAAAVATGLLTSAHHIFRLGPEVLVAAVLVTVVPYALLRWYRASGRNAVLAAATAVNVLVFVWFGFLDGFLDHVLKAVGLENVTILPGGEADVVATYFALWSPAAGDAFYEVTGVLTFIASAATLVLNILLVRAARRLAPAPIPEPAVTRGA
jgi:hypothetical protein